MISPSSALSYICRSYIATKRLLKWGIFKSKVPSSGPTYYFWLTPDIYLPLLRNEAIWHLTACNKQNKLNWTYPLKKGQIIWMYPYIEIFCIPSNQFESFKLIYLKFIHLRSGFSCIVWGFFFCSSSARGTALTLTPSILQSATGQRWPLKSKQYIIRQLKGNFYLHKQ